MERRNSPTTVGYVPEANNNVAFADADMKGMQVKEPLATATAVNTMEFDFPTTGYQDIEFSFAAINELTNATGLLIDYSTVSGTPVWQTAGLASSTLALTSAYQLFNVDFSSIAAASNNANFKVRLRFTGSNLTVDNGNRVTFNNIAAYGTPALAVPQNQKPLFTVYPNPATDIVNVSGVNSGDEYRMFAMDGRLVASGKFSAAMQVSVSDLGTGVYLLQITSGDRTATQKIVRE